MHGMILSPTTVVLTRCVAGMRAQGVGAAHCVRPAHVGFVPQGPIGGCWVAEEVIAALSGGGAAVAQMEIARLVNTAVLRLSGRGRAAAELARVADAAARSDTDLAEAMDRISQSARQAPPGSWPRRWPMTGRPGREQAATADLRAQAEQVRKLLINHGLTLTGNPSVAVQHNSGQIVQNTGPGTVHASFRVGGDYTAGTDTSAPRPTNPEPDPGRPDER